MPISVSKGHTKQGSTQAQANRVAAGGGVMVSPGRMVNLSNTPPTLECRMRQYLDHAMRKAKFTHHVPLCENLLLEALMNARQYRAQPHHSYRGKKVTRLSFGAARPKDRDQEQIRMHLLGMIWYAWSRGTQQKPIINNRRVPDTPFVIFVKAVWLWYGFGNVIKYLERYQSYRKATFAGKTFSQWRAPKQSNGKLALNPIGVTNNAL